MDGASGSGERRAIGEKTHISLKAACIICVIAVVPLTIFIKGMSDDLTVIKQWMQTTEARTQKSLDDHEGRLRLLEVRKP